MITSYSDNPQAKIVTAGGDEVFGALQRA